MEDQQTYLSPWTWDCTSSSPIGSFLTNTIKIQLQLYSEYARTQSPPVCLLLPTLLRTIFNFFVLTLLWIWNKIFPTNSPFTFLNFCKVYGKGKKINKKTQGNKTTVSWLPFQHFSGVLGKKKRKKEDILTILTSDWISCLCWHFLEFSIQAGAYETNSNSFLHNFTLRFSPH